MQRVEASDVLEGRLASSYSAVLSGFARTAEAYEHTLHDLVKGYLQKTRSDNEAVQLAAIRALHTIWDAGIDATMAAHSAESMPFLVEALETGGRVERATKDLLARMNEDEGGSSSGEESDSDASDSVGSMDEDDE